MPNRLLRESICTSDSIDSLSWFEEVLFYRLIVNCDDYGRFDGRAAVIKSRLFPLKDNVTVKSIDAAMNKLVSAELVVLYVFEGKPYLYLPTWDRHQTVRAKKSRYPAPDVICDHLQANDFICKQMHADVPVIQSNPNPNPIRESESNCAPARDVSAKDAAFDAFWEAYPKKVGKAAAKKAFDKVPKNVWDKLVPSVNIQKQSRQWLKDDGQFIPNPATWLNQGRWDDVVAPSSPSKHTVSDADVNRLDYLLECLDKI